MSRDNYSPMYKTLIREAIGSRTQAEFARAAGISRFSLSHILSAKETRIPFRGTLVKIADASEGRVSAKELLAACGRDWGQGEEG